MGTPTSLRLADPELERVKRLAEQTMRKQSDLLRYAVALGLDQIERQISTVRKEV